MGMDVSAGLAARDLAAELGPDRVLTSGPAYDESRRIWNGAVDHRPALVVRGGTAAEVRAAVLAARSHELPLSVLGGGHDWAGRALRHSGLVIDLSAMRHVAVDAGDAIATAGGGATASDVIAAGAPHGLSAATGTWRARW
jgi:FAD/FMN-containing dehydrogenase